MYRVSLAVNMPAGPNRGLIVITFCRDRDSIESKFVSYHNRAQLVIMNL